MIMIIMKTYYLISGEETIFSTISQIRDYLNSKTISQRYEYDTLLIYGVHGLTSSPVRRIFVHPITGHVVLRRP